MKMGELKSSFFRGKEVHLMLTIQHLTIKDLKDHTLINDFTFSLGEHDKVALIGEEGNGKSTLLKAIYQKSMITSYTSISGTIDMDYERIGYLSQRLDEVWNQETCLDYILKQHITDEIAPDAYNQIPQLQALCTSLRIPLELLLSLQPIHTLSGGEKVKLQLLKLSYFACDLYLLDEPTNDLDIHTLLWLEKFILNVKAPVMFVSHDETLLRNTANRILHIEQRNKKTKSAVNDVRGSYDAYIEQRTNAHLKEQQIATKEKQEYLKKKEKLNDIRNAVHAAQNNVSRQQPHTARMLKKKMHMVKAMEHRFEEASYAKVDSVEEAIDIYFDDAKGIPHKIILDQTIGVEIAGNCLIHPYAFHIRGCDKLAIIGDNGCGKTQLIKKLYEILSLRTDISLGYMPQNYADIMNQNQTAIEFLLQEHDQFDISRSRELLGRMHFTTDEMTQHISCLSEGQKAKLFILRFIKMSCNVLLLDEPTRNLSPLSAPVIRQVFKDYQGCLIAITHDRLFLKEVFNQVYEVSNYKLQPKENNYE